ncbi:uncharacterized protein LOC113563430 [Ooceraea biroi]|uniref:uncharacterized protein LOC113563430 n=1 Tax=Ooceraea biroi TaxID=2015173 RepID=UPI000F0924E9|nr:uncharacterized protein LOC113563430 [Ooceraea biroi]
MRVLLNIQAIPKASPAEIKHLISTVSQAARSFKSMDRPVDQWDDWFVHILVEKLDAATRLLWESSLESGNDFPRFSELLDFLQTRVRALESTGVKSTQSSPSMQPSATKPTRKGGCNQKHHTLLHPADGAELKGVSTAVAPSDPGTSSTTDASSDKTASSTVAALSTSTNSRVLLVTARVNLIVNSGRVINVRALLDSGSEASFVSERVAQLLQLPRQKVRVTVSGLQGTATGTASHVVSLMVGSPQSPSLRIAVPRALVLPKLTSLLPGERVELGDWQFLEGLPLADPEFSIPAAVDCILGADLFGMLQEEGPNVSSLHATVCCDLHEDLQKFWELERAPAEQILTPEDQACEDLFRETTVVFHWLRAHPSKWRIFVANHVSELQELVALHRWRFVPSRDNPADVATRGLSPTELANLSLWWLGPSWLTGPTLAWPQERKEAQVEIEEQELRPVQVLAAAVRAPSRRSAFDGFEPSGTPTAPSKAVVSPLPNCRLRWLRISQQHDFGEEIRLLSDGQRLPRRSPLLSLRPFFDQNGLLRVGGRLQGALLSYEERHPVILAKRSHLALLLVRDAHGRCLHAGPQLTRSVLARRYWILQFNSLVRAVTHQCVKCARYRGDTASQQMAHLPDARVRPSRPFSSAGVDYAGPIRFRAHKGRGQKTLKGYICLFVCLASRAVHLEMVSDLSSAAFLAAFHRFTARRGHCTRLMSDNATNFRCADKELCSMFRSATDFYEQCRDQLLATLLCFIEACLNSRPLHPLSNSPADLTALTPGHLLIGEAPIVVPGPPADPDSRGHVSNRWTLISNLKHHFWRRWAGEYLHRMQQLPKWRETRDNLQLGALVLIKDELTPPAK